MHLLEVKKEEAKNKYDLPMSAGSDVDILGILGGMLYGRISFKPLSFAPIP